MRLRVLLPLFLLAFCVIDGISAGRTSGSRSSSRTSSSGSYGSRGSSYGKSYSTSYGSRSGTSYGGSHSTSYGGGSHGVSHGSPSGTSHGTTFGTGTSFGTSHTSPTRTGTSPTHGQTAHERSKDLSTSLLHAEGGGATRPAQTKPPTSFGGSHSPSAPVAPSAPYPHSSNPYGSQHPHEPGKPRLDNDPKQTSPHMTSAPSATTFGSQSQAPTSFGQPGGPYHPGQNNPSWSNPHLGTNQPVAPGVQAPHVGFKEHLYTPSATGTNSYHPNLHGSNPPYPVQSSGHPYPVHGSSPYPVQHGTNVPYPIGGQSFGHPSYHPSAPIIPGQNNFNTFSHPSQPPMGNPYSTYHPGSAYAPPGGQPQYTPHVLSQPAAQPFVPGHTVIMMPGQQDSGRGVGQILKEALIFSTVNAAVNRVVNPHHHYVSESRPAESSGSAPTTHITYNNQYFNTYPGVNGTADANGAPQGGIAPSFNPVGVPPITSGTSFPTVPGSTNNVNVPSGSSGVPGGIATAPGVAAPGISTMGSTGVQATQGNTNNTTPNPINNAPQYRVSDDDLMKISEELFTKQDVNLTKYVTVNLQSKSSSQFPNLTDEAKEPLFIVQPEILEYPSIFVTRALYDNYEFDSQKKENRTAVKREEENLLIDTFLETNVMSRAMQWLAERGFIDHDDFERKDILRHIWFNQFDGTTSGFERVFVAEKYGNSDILGVQDWIYFDYKESKKEIDYMGYVDKLDLGNNSMLLKLNFQMDGVIRPNATIFVGTTPELEMSLYTLCFYARPNNLCPVSLGGSKFNIFTHSFRYYGNDLIDLGMPIF